MTYNKAIIISFSSLIAGALLCFFLLNVHAWHQAYKLVVAYNKKVAQQQAAPVPSK